MKKLIHIILFSAFSLFYLSSKGQALFSPKQLQNPKKYGPEVKALFKEELVYEFKVDSGKHAIFLQNGLRSSNFVHPEYWLKAKDTLYPYRVDIVYSRYPVHNNVYHEIYPLLCNRLIHLFRLDPTLNDAELEWRTVLQTHIENDDQVNTLFHGIVIWYKTEAEENGSRETTPAKGTVNTLSVKEMEKLPQSSRQEALKYMDEVIHSDLLPDSVRVVLANKPPDEQTRTITSFLETKAAKTSEIPLQQRSPLEMQLFKRQITEFMKLNPVSDSVVMKVMSRHPEWADALVVNDWTGSMYGYGAQIVNWHLLNYQQSGIRYITLFNDGDNKPTWEKAVGNTGGIYSAEASDIPKIINLFNLVRMKGSGGDRPENDIEAILESMKRFPNQKEIILIADNYACIRDIEMAEKIQQPVRIIICGYLKQIGINPHLAYLAKVTGGGLYTLEEDIENLKMEIGGGGEIKSIRDKRFVVHPMNCNLKANLSYSNYKEVFKTYTHLDSALLEKKSVRQLDLKEQQLNRYPKEINKLQGLLSLDVSNNGIAKIPGSVKKLENLKELNLSNNQLISLPRQFVQLKNLEMLDISHNRIVTLSEFYPSWYYVKTLKLDHNQLQTLENINNLKNLKLLDASDNQLSELPAEIHQLKKLTMLDLSNNKLLYLPRTFTGLNKLEELNLENNQLGSLPPYLYRLRKLKVLRLSGNPLGEKEKNRIRKELPDTEIIF